MFIFCFVVIPAILLVYGIAYLYQQEHKMLINANQQEMSLYFKKCQAFADPEAFWSQYLNLALDSRLLAGTDSESFANLKNALAELKRDLKFDHVVFSPDQGVIETTVKIEPRDSWLLSLNLFQKILRGKKRFPGKATPAEESAIGHVFGPQINLRHLQNSHVGKPHMVWPDSINKKPLLWCKCVGDTLLVLMIDQRELESVDFIRNFLRRFSLESKHKLKFALFNDAGKIETIETDAYLLPQLQQAMNRYQGSSQDLIVTDDLYVVPFFVRPGVSLLGFFAKDQLRQEFNWRYLLAVILFVLASYLLCRYSYRVFIKEVPDSISLRWKLRFLFFFANGLPLIVLFFLGTDYLTQKRDALFQETLSRGISLLQSFDESFESEYAKILVNKRVAEEKLLKSLAVEEINNEILDEFVTNISDYEMKILLVASSSETIGTERGLFNPRKNLYPRDYAQRSAVSISQIEFTTKIGKYFVDSVNGAKISDKIATEMEMLIESVTQKPVVNFIFSMMQNRGYFTQWGFGDNVHPAILDTFSLGYTQVEDFFFLAIFRTIKLQHQFLTRILPTINRNNLGLKVVALSDEAYSLPLNVYSNRSLRDFSSTLTSFPGDEIKLIDYQGEKHLAMGFKGTSIGEYCLIGLYPVSRIDSLILLQKKQLTVFALLSLLVTFVLSQILAQSFLVPLRQLSFGAKAIEEKQFGHRLPQMGRDEFGKMGQIFNEVMVDLDELSVASAIQEQLLPQERIPTGKYSLFGKSISMGELGGDYFDFIELEQGHFSVMLGDVAGHGVGAALIMAMAKAGIIQSDHLLDRPRELITRLHGLIYNSKTRKQKKIMTFQYLYLDGQRGSAVYSNAGACSPMIIRKEQKLVEELKLDGAALGAFKKAKFSEVNIRFSPGDAMVFYTDGIVEARNDAGEELGYERLRTLLLESWDIDASKFYENIYQSYLAHLGNQSPQDDLTMIVLVYTGKDQSEPLLP